MKLNNYIPRIADRKLADYLRAFGAVCIEGPKWCGKTWTAMNQAASACMIADPADNYKVRRRVELDLNYAFEGAKPRLIDEWQEFPSLWDATRFHVDFNGGPGQIILTGSSTPCRKGIMHSGIGRIASLRLRPMSLYESGVSSGKVSLKKICQGEDIGIVDVKRPELGEIVELVMRGGWPGTIRMPFKTAVNTPFEYARRLVEQDIQGFDGASRNQVKVELLLRSLARNESTVAGISTIRADISAASEERIEDNTIVSYIDALTRLFVLENQKPFSLGMRSGQRLRKAEKRHFCDPSLAAAFLQATPEKLLNDLETLGFLFESLVERDLRTYAEAFDGRLYHYQDYDGREIDAIVELPDARWAAIEVKLGCNQEDKAAENLKRIAASFERHGNPPVAMIVVLGLSSAAYRRKDGVYSVPITALKD